MNNKQETIVESAIQKFIDESLGELIDKDFIYNEFSLQHELGIYLRKKLGKEYQIRFERNALDMGLGIDKDALIKKEIDIEISNDKDRFAIELKFPLKDQGAVEMHMCHFIEDIIFMKQMKDYGFKQTFVLTLVNDTKYYKETSRDCKEVYKYFRVPQVVINDKKLKDNSDELKKYISKIENITLGNEQKFNWEKVQNCSNAEYRFYFHPIYKIDKE